MNCPICRSTNINGPIFGAPPGRRRERAVMRCTSCRGVFDAYEWAGTGR